MSNEESVPEANAPVMMVAFKSTLASRETDELGDTLGGVVFVGHWIVMLNRLVGPEKLTGWGPVVWLKVSEPFVA